MDEFVFLPYPSSVDRALANAAKDLLNHPGCADPDCCKTAIAEDRARQHLRVALEQWCRAFRVSIDDL